MNDDTITRFGEDGTRLFPRRPRHHEEQHMESQEPQFDPHEWALRLLAGIMFGVGLVFLGMFLASCTVVTVQNGKTGDQIADKGVILVKPEMSKTTTIDKGETP